MSMLSEFKDFAMKGNVIDMAVGIIIGAAFGPIVKSLVGDVIMPPIGMLMNGIDFSSLHISLSDNESLDTLAKLQEAGEPAIAYGLFINTIINFVIVAFAVFLLVKGMNAAKKKEEEKPAAPPAPSKEEVLLGEIRDLLKQR